MGMNGNDLEQELKRALIHLLCARAVLMIIALAWFALASAFRAAPAAGGGAICFLLHAVPFVRELRLVRAMP